MSTDTYKNDSPWRRLPWTLPAALALLGTALWAVAYFTGKPVERLPEPPSIEAQVIEIPAPAISKPPEQKSTPPSTPQAPPQHAQPSIAPHASQEEKSAPAPTLAQPTASPLSKATSDAPATNLASSSGAQAIVRPMPQIPDELRQDALSTSAIARFHVATDGTATVELVKPTPNPRLNRLLLDTLKNWRFFPAMKDGKPVDSTQEISIKVNVQ
jgi:protein TonB